MLDELRQRTYETKNRLLDLQLEESFDNGREIILLKILKRFRGKTVRTLPKNIQKELVEFKNLIESRRKEKSDFTLPYGETPIPRKNKENKRIDKNKDNEFEKISINDLLNDYEEINNEIKKSSRIKTFQIILLSLIPPTTILISYFNNFINKALDYVRNLMSIIFSVFFILISNQGQTKSPEQMIEESIANYPGKCPCPYSIMSNGKKCGKRSAYSKPGGYEPLCYISDITGDKENDAKTQAQIRIVDGDTININKVKYRLHGIDAPEMKQLCKMKEKNYKCGVKSKEFLVSLIGNQSVKCNQKDIDRYKRIVAECFVGKTNLNKELVRNGWALAYRDYSKDYVTDEEFAQENNLGMWKGTFIHPKKWRKLNR